MSGWMNNIFGRKQTATETIITIREQLVMIDKKEEHIERRIEEEHKKAKALVADKKTASAKAALRRKKTLETELERLSGTRLTLEMQVSALESAHFNAQTVATMSNTQKALKQIHREIHITELDKTMQDIREEIDSVDEIQRAISMPLTLSDETEAELLRELEEMEQEELDERLRGADDVPVEQLHVPTSSRVTVKEEDEDEELRQLQASLAM